MLRLSVSVDEWLKIGEDINVVIVGVGGDRVKLMIDAPKDIPVSRSRAREKYLSQKDYEKEQKAVAQTIRNEKDAKFELGDQVDLRQWITDGERKGASYAVIGKGQLARDCYNVIFSGGTQRLIAYVNPQRVKDDCNIRLDEDRALLDPQIDYIVVAVPDVKGYRGIVNKLRDMGLSKEKIFWAAKV